MAGLSLTAATCSPERTHRVLVFLYDGVPPLGAGMGEASSESPDAATAAEADQPSAARKPKQILYHHPAYLANECGGCHDVDGATLLKTVRQGLCQMCHPDNPPKKKFVHGPVAVNGCLACHRYHKSQYPKVLVTDAQSLCFRCHVTEELILDEHHATIGEERCIDCHDAHGGDDRYFLLPKAKMGGSS
jgi:predicted CXXCH cytochrome family protein